MNPIPAPPTFKTLGGLIEEYRMLIKCAARADGFLSALLPALKGIFTHLHNDVLEHKEKCSTYSTYPMIPEKSEAALQDVVRVMWVDLMEIVKFLDEKVEFFPEEYRHLLKGLTKITYQDLGKHPR